VPEPGWLEAYKLAIRTSCQVYEGKTTCRDGLTSPLHVAPANETGGYLWSCNMMIHAELFRTIGGFDEHFPFPAMEDVDFRERLRDRRLEFQFTQAAVVDHPPRKLKGLRELTSQHRSYLFYRIVKRREVPRFHEVLLTTLRVRVRSCFRPAIRDLPRALGLFSCECFILCMRYRSWRRQTLENLTDSGSKCGVAK
jgi:GT2 family glycosyltransferase